MQTRKLGWTDLEVTTIGLGTWAIGGSGWKYGWGPQEEEDSIATIQRALDCGVNWLDTAAVYGFGASEEVVGKAIRGRTSRPIIATKCGLIPGDGGMPVGCIKRESVRKECEDSLKRLGIDCIDLYQTHWPNPQEDIEEGWTAVAELIAEGKVRYGGVSNFNIEQMQRAQAIHRIASLQPPYSMIRRQIEGYELEYCAKNEIGVIAYSPMQKGILTDKFTREWAESLPESDHRSGDGMFKGEALEGNLKLVAGLKEIAARHGRSVAEVAVAWVLRRPEVTSAIVGARRPEQAEANAAFGDWDLPTEDIDAIEQLLA